MKAIGTKTNNYTTETFHIRLIFPSPLGSHVFYCCVTSIMSRGEHLYNHGQDIRYFGWILVDFQASHLELIRYLIELYYGGLFCYPIFLK